MNIIYEKLEDFLERLKKEKPDTVYLSKLNTVNEEKIATAVINIQMQIMDDVITYRYTDLPKVQLLPESYFEYMSEEVKNEQKKKYEQKIEHANAIITSEYEKLKKVLTEMGIPNIENAIVQ